MPRNRSELDSFLSDFRKDVEGSVLRLVHRLRGSYLRHEARSGTDPPSPRSLAEHAAETSLYVAHPVQRIVMDAENRYFLLMRSFPTLPPGAVHRPSTRPKNGP